ncbi:MAG: hypothetical protein IH619_04245, partial [Ignavibacterium sp.]|nr:hypothetical protein [Ignavibacterium sp.]
SFMVIDNDYVGYYSSGINGAKVTVAHEFHHGIQGGNYAPAGSNSPFRNSDVFYYEITSTAFEEFVFDDVNDYYAYMPSYFQNPETAISLNDGYNLAIWNIYLQNNFGFDILKRQWELLPSQGSSALKSIALSINEYGSTLGNELSKFGIWTYYTNSRTISGRYFEEANNYPLINPTATVSFTPPIQNYTMSVGPAANYFLKINLPSPDGVFYTIITNSDWQKANDNPGQSLPFTYTLYDDNISGTRVISDNYSATFNNDNQTFWNNVGILNNNVVYGDSNFTVPSIESETFAYPVPYKLSSSGNIRIVFSSKQSLGEEVNLSIYSAGLDLYFSGNKIIQSTYLKNGKTYCELILDKNDANFFTGVYIYFIRTGTDIFKGKLVIFND